VNFIVIYPPSAERVAEFPVGGLFLADALAKRGYSCGIICDRSPSEIYEDLDQMISEDTIAIGLSVVSTLIFKDAIRISQELKSKYPHKPLVWGGQAVSAQKEQMLEFDPVDYVCVGDGEEALPDLLDALERGVVPSDIVGIGYMSAGEPTFNGIATYTDFDQVFELPYELVDVDRYFRNLNIGGDRWLGAIYSRGCPFRCTFCIVSAFGSNIGTMRYHSFEHVMHDLKVLTQKYGADAISIHDDHFLINQKRVEDFCERVLEAEIRIDFRCNGRIDSICRMEDSALRLMRRAGFVNLIAGIETGSPTFLETMKKKLTLDQVAVADRRLTEHGFYKHWNFMSAMPGETFEDTGHTLWLIAQLAKTSMTSSYPMSYRKYIPLPGTVMYRQAVEEYGFSEPDNLEDWAAISESYMSERSYGNAGALDIRERPWLSADLGEYIQRGEDAVEGMNQLFTGEESDRQAIISAIEALESIALESIRGKTEYPRVDYVLDYTAAVGDDELRHRKTSLQRRHASTYAR
jgi:anaerobic magnesium-protoporphyrin IX monomethyl ester cyclase